MKRDMDLIRAILLAVEDEPSSHAPEIEIQGYTQEQVGYHAELLKEAGFVELYNDSDMIRRLTWSGHEFLDSARDNTRWNQAKDKLNKAGGASIPIWIALLTELVKKQIGL